MDRVKYVTLFLGAVFSRWPPPSSPIITTAIITQLASPLPSPALFPASSVVRTRVLSSASDDALLPPTIFSKPHSHDQVTAVVITLETARPLPHTSQLGDPSCFCAFYPPVLRAVASITLSYNSLSSTASCLLPDSQQHHTGLFSQEKSTEISRLPLVTYQLWKISLRTGVGCWLMSSCSVPVWSRSWVLLIKGPWELKRTEIQGYPRSSHWPCIRGCALTDSTVLHSGSLSIFQRVIKKLRKKDCFPSQ